MEKAAIIDRMGICAIVISAGILSACGGGAAGSGATAAAATLPDTSSASTASTATANATTPAPADTAASASDSSVTAASSASAYAEAVDTLADLRTLGSSTSLEAISVSSLTADGGAVAAAASTGVDNSALLATATPAATTNVTALAAVSVTKNYVKVTDEYHSFVLTGTGLVRFGSPTTNTWVTKTITGYGECSNAYFGSDPASGIVKECQALAANAPLAALAAMGPILSTAVGKMPQVNLAAVPTPWLGSSMLQIQATSEIAPASDEGQFRTTCNVARLSFDDPIVFPGQTGKSHLHTFFGNTGTTANSTPDSLRTTGTSTCRGGTANRSAYWVPTIIDTRTGIPVISDGIGVYYKSGYLAPATINAVPVGLRMIAGDPTRTTAGATSITRFKCLGGPNNENDKYGPSIGNCDVGATMVQEVFFPSCWDGVNLDSPDHKSHMSYPINSAAGVACPSAYPVAIPSITFNVSYTVTAKDQPLYWRLASDNYASSQPAGYSSHGDWFNGWQKDVSDAWAKSCVKASKDCHSHLLGDGRMMY